MSPTKHYRLWREVHRNVTGQPYRTAYYPWLMPPRRTEDVEWDLSSYHDLSRQHRRRIKRAWRAEVLRRWEEQR